MNRGRLIAVACTLALVAGAVVGQSVAQPVSQPAAQPVPSTKPAPASGVEPGQQPLAKAPAVNEEQRAAINELLAAMNFKKTMSQMAGAVSQSMPQMMDQMIDSFAKSRSEVNAQKKEEMRRLAREKRAVITQQIVDLYSDPEVILALEDTMGAAYAKRFSTPEIQKITAFYNSPEGRKFQNYLPEIMQEAMPQIMRHMTPRMTALLEKNAKEISAQIDAAAKPATAPSPASALSTNPAAKK